MSVPAVVLISGPPGSGKDTLAGFGELHGNLLHMTGEMQYGSRKVQVIEFKEVLFKLVREHYGVECDQWNDMYRRESKELPNACLGGISPRAAMIHVSQTIIKPKHGKDYFAKCLSHEAMDQVKANPHLSFVFVVPDCGFQEEVETLKAAFGAVNVLLVRLHRDGCTFANDSRSYVYDSACPSIDVRNKEGELALCRETVAMWVQGWLQESTRASLASAAV